MPLPPAAEWMVDTLRLTVFSAAPIPVESASYFGALTGGAPEVAQRLYQTGEYSESGPYEEGRLEVKGALNRLDVVHVPLPHPTSNGTIPALGSLVEQLPQFVRKFGSWLAASDISPVRVALGASVWFPTVDRVENNTRIRDMVGFVTFDPAQVSDVALQFNIPKACEAAAGVTLNQIVRLQSLLVRLFHVGGVTQQFQELEQSICRIEFDFNTAELSSDSPVRLDVSAVLAELQGSIIEKLERGIR